MPCTLSLSPFAMNPAPCTKSSSSILFTFDVEDWFQVENFKECIPFSSWSSRELRVEKNTHRILDLIDSVRSQGAASSLRRRRIAFGQFLPETDQGDKQSSQSCKSCLKATFFVLGWIAERLPHLVREIAARGHEVASHGYGHNLCNEQSSERLEDDLRNSKKLLEDIIGGPVHGYRAPSFSINEDVLKMIEDCGYLYDSSFNSFSMHARYGHVELAIYERNGISAKISESFYELPISNLKLGNRVLPWGGGGYFRLIPFFLFSKGVRSIMKADEGYMFYLHPWEIDPEQPKVEEANRVYKFRHYVNLNRTEKKLISLFETFSDCKFVTCSDYLKDNSQF
jgi:polysaccharide deacetylase family protein (PEP-CTERM system associated)